MSSSSPRKRIKSEIAADTAHARGRNRPLPVEGTTPRPPSDLRVLPVCRHDSSCLFRSADFPHPNFIQDQPDQRSVVWRDPNTGEVFTIDSRTGNTVPASRDNFTGTEPNLDDLCSTSYVDRRWLKRRSPAELGLSSSTPSLGWIQSALDVGAVSITTVRNVS